MTDLMQDGPGCAEGRRYARWFADRLDAMWLLRKAHNERKTTMTTPDLTEARRLADEWEPKRPGISGVLRDLAAEVERLRAQVAAWESELSAVMPADFKDWHQNSRSEWPAVAADVIRSQREDRDLGWEMAARAQVAPDVDALAQHIRRVNGNNDMGAGALAESIVEWLAAAPAQQAHPESFADQALASETATSRPTPSLTVGERAELVSSEYQRILHEAQRVGAAEAYFGARAWMLDTNANRRLFEAGFDAGAAAQTQPAAQAGPVAWVWNPAREAWERVHIFGHWQPGATYAIGPNPPEPCAWVRQQFIHDDAGYSIGTDDPELYWGDEPPEGETGWIPLYGDPLSHHSAQGGSNG